MRVSESLWIGEKILKLTEVSKSFPLLNIGSSTKRFREKEQPSVQKNIFDRICANCSVDHLDIKAHEGVDIIGDLTYNIVLDHLKLQCYDAILCSNLLEHVRNPIELCRCMEDCVKEGGYSLVTVPHLYPYHNDPIDTMFRPDVEELLNYFKESRLVEGEILIIDDSHMRILMRDKRLLILTIIR